MYYIKSLLHGGEYNRSGRPTGTSTCNHCSKSQKKKNKGM